MTKSRPVRHSQQVHAVGEMGSDRFPAVPGVWRATGAAPSAGERAIGIRPVRLEAAASPVAARIVVTDHDSDLLWLLQELLQEEGYEALVPPELDDPCPFVKARRPAAVVLDAPFRREAAALEVLDTLRLDPALATTPVVVCTTAPERLQHLAGREAEGLYLLAKPFDLDQLLAVLAAALRAPPPENTSLDEEAITRNVDRHTPEPAAGTAAVRAGIATQPA